MIVFKFGGASVKNAEAIQNVAEILKSYYQTMPLIVVVSAIDKTTNALEDLARLATQYQTEQTWMQYDKIKQFHTQIIHDLFPTSPEPVLQSIEPFFEELKSITQGILLLGDYPNRIWDKVMAFGELLSTTIVCAYLNHLSIPSTWLDARQLIVTDHQYRQADVLWHFTTPKVKALSSQIQKGSILLTQGYIGSTQDGITTTLGREGSDYTASILGSILQAEKVVVWKDVPGIMSADPKRFPDAQKIDFLSYEQAIEMTFYGATVIHPKTIKPLKNQNIPLQVKSFIEPKQEGSWIGLPSHQNNQHPIRIIKKNVSVFTIKPRDFSFMDETWTSSVYNYATKCGVKVLLVQSSAISLQLCLDLHSTRNQEFENLLQEEFIVHVEHQLFLHSLLNYHAPFCFEEQAFMAQKIHHNYHWVTKDEKI